MTLSDLPRSQCDSSVPEGGGRSHLAFVGLIGLTDGHPSDFERIDRTTFLSAMIASYSGKRASLAVERTNLLS